MRSPNRFNDVVVLGFVLTCLASSVASASAQTDAAQQLPPLSPAFDMQTRAPRPSERSSYDVEVIAIGLVQPWALAFLPDGRMLVTERPGRMRIVARDGLLSEPLGGVPAIRDVRGRGLAGLALDPGFSDNRFLYISYFAPPPGEPGGPMTSDAYDAWAARSPTEREANPIGFRRVARARLSDDATRLENLEVLLDSGARRLRFAPDGTLFVTTWAHSAFPGKPETGYEEPQQLDLMGGKIVRIKSDGSVPSDNPWADRDDARPEIFARGFRDAEGAVIHPDTGQLWTVEHGPRGGDELNAIEAGRNYGYPIITYGREYTGGPVGEGLSARDGMEQPVYFWNPSIAPSGLLFYDGDLFPEWRGNLFVGAMAGKHLVRLVLDGTRVTHEERLLEDLELRIRDVRQGPDDGALYLLTSEEEGQILRLSPRE